MAEETPERSHSEDEPKPVTTLDRVELWYRETDAAERAALSALPKLFKRGEGIECPLE